jgi:hypothetical protein
MFDSTAAVAAERQGKSARQLLETVPRDTGDEGIASQGRLHSSTSGG